MTLPPAYKYLTQIFHKTFEMCQRYAGFPEETKRHGARVMLAGKSFHLLLLLAYNLLHSRTENGNQFTSQ